MIDPAVRGTIGCAGADGNWRPGDRGSRQEPRADIYDNEPFEVPDDRDIAALAGLMRR